MRVALLALLAGCDGLLGLYPLHPLTDAAPDAPPDAAAPCSQFATVTPVAFSGPVVVSDFNVSLDEKTGVYFGKPTAGASTPGVNMLSRAGITDPWLDDGARGAPQSNLISPRLVGPDDLLAGTPKVSTAGFNLDEFVYTGGVWPPGMQIDFGAGYDALPTGYALTNVGREVVESQRTGTAHRLSILTSSGSTAWTAQLQTAINAAGNTTAGALSPDGLVMVYAQYPGTTTTGSDLYVTYRSDPAAEFPAGTKIRLPGPDSEELEPWLVDNTCSHLYFRRDTTVLIATP